MTASQSSTDKGGVADRAFNRPIVRSYPGTCTHTKREQDPWWKVNLGGAYAVQKIVLTNRQYCCPDRLQGVDVSVDDTVCAQGVNVAEAETKEVPCTGTGTTIKIQLKKNTSLTLCGFAAYG